MAWRCFGSLRAALTVLLIGCTATVTAERMAPFEVVGLFKNQAVVRMPGGAEQVLKAGVPSPQGVLLVSATPHEGVFEYAGERYTLGLSNRVSSGFTTPEPATLIIPADQMGQYRVRGAINDHYVSFLVDTGASVVALSASQAASIGLDYSRGERGQVQTAQGTATSWFVSLDEVKVAGLSARNVQAAVIDGSYPAEILLGMSFLRQMRMHEQDGAMVLTQKY
jgi:aspartyl protease family protein